MFKAFLLITLICVSSLYGRLSPVEAEKWFNSVKATETQKSILDDLFISDVTFQNEPVASAWAKLFKNINEHIKNSSHYDMAIASNLTSSTLPTHRVSMSLKGITALNAMRCLATVSSTIAVLHNTTFDIKNANSAEQGAVANP